MSQYKSIAIDGPSGAGKSSIAKQLSKKLNYIYVDTGALYRAIGFYMVSNSISTLDEKAVVTHLKNIQVQLKYIEGSQRVVLNNNDITEQIRSPEISIAASNTSAIAEVRDFLLALQRNFSKNSNVIMDGRDIGTVILPNADIKIFLTASKKSRALRRYREFLANGVTNISFDEVYNDINLRDENDTFRKIAPLKQADDAILIDSSDMDFNETLNYIYKIIKEKI